MKTKEIISVIVPVYNAEKYLNRCVDSILNQTYPHLEVILVDDGSPDNCPQICDDYLKRDARIKVFHQENKGASGARNNGLRNATGDYIAFVDSDDWIDVEMYSEMMKLMASHEQQVVECNLVNRFEDTEPKPEHKREVVIQDSLTAMTRVIANQDFSACTRLYSREVIGDQRFKEGVMAEDVYFAVTLIDKIDSLVFMSDPFYNYFNVGDSVTRGPYKLKSLDSLTAARYVDEKINSDSKYTSLKSITKRFVTEMLLMNYKGINHNHKVDPQQHHRKQIKKDFGIYVDSENSSPSLLIAKYAPVKWYNAMVRLNRWLKGGSTN